MNKIHGGLLELFAEGGDSVKVLEFLTDYPEGDFSKKDLMGNTGVSFRKIQKIVRTLDKVGILMPTRNIARAQLYRLNESNEVFKALIQLEFLIVKNVSKQD